MKYTKNIGLPIVEDNDLYSKEINNLAFEEIDKNIEALAERIDLIDDPETGLGNLLEIMVRKEDIAQDLDTPERETILSTEALAEILDKKTEEIETLIEDTDNATRLDLTNNVLLNKVTDVALNDSDELIVTYGDGTELNVGVVGTGGAGTSSENKIEVDTSTDEEYILKITTNGTDFLTPNLKGAGDNIFVGTEIDGTSTPIIADITGSHIGDIYINADNGNLYVRDDENNVNNHWTYKGNIRGIQGKSNYDLALDNGFIGTEQDYLDSLVAENIEALIVANKPVLADPSTKLKTWYYYQVDGDTDNSAWKYKMVLPNTADYPAGDYCVYYDLKPYCGTFTAESPALTNKDKYKYYVIMDLQAVTTEVIREDLNTGNTVVLETVQCVQQEPTTHTVINAPMESLGKWVQTLFIGATKEEASEVTLSTGTSVSGFITNIAFEETVGNRSNLKTLNKTSIVNAINEHEELLRENTTDLLNTNSKNVIGAINELNAKHYLDVFDLVDGNVLDYALTANALTYTCFYANNCDGLPNNERYGYCYVEVSQDPLYRDLIFNSPTTGRRWCITIGASTDNPTMYGEWSEWHEELLKEDIGDSINSNSTADEIVSAKLAYTNLIRGNSAKQSYLDEIGTNDVLQFPEGKYTIHESVTYANLPEGVEAGYLEIWNMNGKSHETPFSSTWRYRVVKLQDYNTKKSYYRVLRSNGSSVVFVDTGWQRVCSTSVEDVVNVDVTSLLDTTKATAENIVYTVKNGWCIVKFNSLKPLTSATKISILPKETLPKSNGYVYTNIGNWDATPAQNILMRVGVTGELAIWCASGNENVSYFGSFSYPVAE